MAGSRLILQLVLEKTKYCPLSQRFSRISVLHSLKSWILTNCNQFTDQNDNHKPTVLTFGLILFGWNDNLLQRNAVINSKRRWSRLCHFLRHFVINELLALKPSLIWFIRRHQIYKVTLCNQNTKMACSTFDNMKQMENTKLS